MILESDCQLISNGCTVITFNLARSGCEKIAGCSFCARIHQTKTAVFVYFTFFVVVVRVCEFALVAFVCRIYYKKKIKYFCRFCLFLCW